MLAIIRMRQLRLHVLATAGNGKTLVARHFFDDCLERGQRPLLLCFNRPLAERLKHLVGRGGMVETWYGFCDQFLRARGAPLNFDDMRTDPAFWTAAAKQVEEQALTQEPADDWRFDTLIVDEAQDFEGDWFEAVRLFLREDAAMLWLEDPNQNVRATTPMALQEQDFVGYQSLLNYRSPETIARFIREALPEFSFTGANDLPGLGVRVTRYQDPSEQPKLIGRLVGQRLKQRFRPQDIAVLSCRGMASTALKGCARVGNHTLRHFTNEYHLLGNQIYSDGQVLFDTVRRFKGQQAAAVILVDVDPRERDLRRELQVLFCGLTRATVQLDVVCAESNPVVRERILPLV